MSIHILITILTGSLLFQLGCLWERQTQKRMQKRKQKWHWECPLDNCNFEVWSNMEGVIPIVKFNHETFHEYKNRKKL